MERKNRMSSDRRERSFLNSAEVDAFEDIFTRYYPLVYRLAYRYVGLHDDAEDIAQEVFLRFYHLPPHAAHEVQQRAWLCRVAINLSLNAVRKRKSGTGQEWRIDAIVQEGALDVTEEQNPEHYVLADEQASLIRSILMQLPERQQVCLTLRSSGFSYQEIAEATGISIFSIGTVLARAIKTFRRLYHDRTTAGEAQF
jgi:RNA polymerase sigma factor (sigma-70 family)